MAQHKEDNGSTRQFQSGATRDTAEGKLDYEAFLSPLVLHAYGVFMDFNRRLPDGTLRDGDNWQKGIPMDAYMKSAYRHFMDWWMWHRDYTHENIVWSLCALIFNASGYLHELLKENPELIYMAYKAAELDRLTDKKINPGVSNPNTGRFAAGESDKPFSSFGIEVPEDPVSAEASTTQPQQPR